MMKLVFFYFLFFSFLHGVEVVPVSQSKEWEKVDLRLIFPRPYENKRSTPINMQMRIKDFPLHVTTPNERAKEIFNKTSGQSIHIFIDNYPYIVHSTSIEGSSVEDQMISLPLSMSLGSGKHIIRAFPTYSYGESVKGESSFIAQTFYLQDKNKRGELNIDLDQPYLTYNEPQGYYPHHLSNPILLDFYLTHCDLSREGYKVLLFIDGEHIETLMKWTPYYLYSLSQGKHLIRLELVDGKGEKVPGYFNVVEREIFIS